MNCRPGDLAFIVGVHPALNLNGRPVRLAASPAFLLAGEPHWKLETPLVTRPTAGGTNVFTGQYIPKDSICRVEEMPDMYLRPIRPQRNDAVDEMVRLVGPAPMTLTELRSLGFV